VVVLVLVNCRIGLDSQDPLRPLARFLSLFRLVRKENGISISVSGIEVMKQELSRTKIIGV
jgi:hypothetical protein